MMMTMKTTTAIKKKKSRQPLAQQNGYGRALRANGECHPGKNILVVINDENRQVSESRVRHTLSIDDSPQRGQPEVRLWTDFPLSID